MVQRGILTEDCKQHAVEGKVEISGVLVLEKKDDRIIQKEQRHFISNVYMDIAISA